MISLSLFAVASPSPSVRHLISATRLFSIILILICLSIRSLSLSPSLRLLRLQSLEVRLNYSCLESIWMVINLLARIPGLPQRNEDHLLSFPPPHLCQIPVHEVRATRWRRKRSEFWNLAEMTGGKKCAEGGQAGWGLMDVDLRVVAVKLTNRFRGVRERERRHVRVIKIHLRQGRKVKKKGIEGSGRRRRVGNCS